MSVARQLFVFLCATTMSFNCKADYQLPEPTDVTYKWDDAFQVNVSWSWKKPDNLPENCTVKFFSVEPDSIVLVNNFTEKLFTEDTRSDHWNISIQAVLDPKCSQWKNSRRVFITIKTTKPRTELVTDFRCSFESNRTKCLWKPVSESLKLNVFYRTGKEKTIRASDRSDSREKSVCYLNTNDPDIYVLVETETGRNTFKPKFVTPLPKMNIAEDNGRLSLTWQHPGPAVGNCGLIFTVCVTECNNDKPCSSIEFPHPLNISYNRNCQYKFKYSVQTVTNCIPLSSDLSEVITYGENRSPDDTLTVIAIVIPIILSACVILSCYCFQRNREILCPRIPDPSTIFKEMMMTGNKDSKPIAGNVYEPVPEPTEHIILVPDNTNPQQNS